MTDKEYKLVIYTQQGTFEINVVSGTEHFEEAIAKALDEAGTVLLNLADGGVLVLTAINTVAIAVYEYEEESAEEKENETNPPRVAVL